MSTIILLLIFFACNEGFLSSKQLQLVYDPSNKRINIDKFPDVTCLYKTFYSADEGPYLVHIGKGDDSKRWEAIEKEIFSFLKQQDLKSDYVSIYVRYITPGTDKYGYETDPTWDYIGEMYVSEIKLYRDFEYFKSTGWSLEKMFEYNYGS